ncbi:hypothetical protein [Dolichospermum sp. UHCC 0259]|uniref:hypothetical protein n=1 Tax=Dolichospermum sp. UHCC 0259 TaxID=2590010 RepID=UPI001446CE05|nr:hypothetical protein [Dolichospermum sp. UHCC 0259]MTJ50542.1 hypothetical protein [Dolichospermum sp. UHCC 0259]
MKDGHNIKLANGIKNQLKGIGVKSNIVLRSVTIEELRKMIVPPVGFEIRADYDEIPAGELLVNKLKGFYPNLVFKLIRKNSDRRTKNYISILLDTFPDEYEERLSTEPLNY